MNGPQPSKRMPPWWVLLIVGGSALLAYLIACMIVAKEQDVTAYLQTGMPLLRLFAGGLTAVAALVMLLIAVAVAGRDAPVGPWAAVLLAGVTVAQPNWATAIGLGIVAAAVVVARAVRAKAAGQNAPPPVPRA